MLFSTARLMEDVSEKRYLPAILSHENLQKVPDYAVMLLGTAGIVLFILTR
jgi:amino acid permease